MWLGQGTKRSYDVSGQSGRALQSEKQIDALDMPALLNALIAAGSKIEVLYVHGHWRGVNDLEDLRQAVDFAHAQGPLAR